MDQGAHLWATDHGNSDWHSFNHRRNGFIECLLSVDNALALAAIVARLPQHQQKLALRLGLAGAYTMRAGLMFLLAS